MELCLPETVMKLKILSNRVCVGLKEHHTNYRIHKADNQQEEYNEEDRL